MKRFFIILAFVLSFMFVNAQDSLRVYCQPEDTLLSKVYYQPEDTQLYQSYNESCNETYFEFGLGAFIPNDESNSLFMFDFELGKYLNKYIGIGLNVKDGQESEYKDRLGYVGPKVRFRVNYSPRNDFDLDIHAGFGYGWLEYNLGYDYDKTYKIINYVVPNVGLTGYINLGRTVSLGIEPSYFWYVSTNKDESTNVGVLNIMGKIKFRF